MYDILQEKLPYGGTRASAEYAAEPRDVLIAPAPRTAAALVHAAVRFDELGPQAFAYLMQVGTNRRLAYQNSGSSSSSGFQALVTSPFPVEGLRRLVYETRIAQAIGNRPARCAERWDGGQRLNRSLLAPAHPARHRPPQCRSCRRSQTSRCRNPCG